MSSATWQIVGDVAVFQTGQYGDIVIPLSSYNSFYDQIREINKQNTSYHEYYHLFNTEVKESDISLTEMNRLLSLYSTPFTDRFAGVGIVYPVPGVGGAVINVTSDQLHLLDPGIVMRQIIVVDGVYHVRTVGIGEGNFAALNTDPRIVDIVWGWIAGANLKQALFELGVPKCFAAGTQVLMADGSSLSIEAVKTGDFVMSFAGEESSGRGMLIPAKVVQTFKNITDEWLLIVPEREFEEVASKNGLTSMRVTPGHRMLASDGSFKEIQDIISFDSKLILSDGSVIRVSHEYIRSDLDAISAVDKYNSRQLELGSDAECFWKTYNFEVEDTHTYIAAGVRVHNDSLFLPQTDEAKLADDILSQISNIIFADNPWQNILIGSALRSFGTVAQDALFGDDDFNGELLLGRYALNVIDSVGGYAGRALVSALIDDADIDPALASALSIFAQQAGSNLAQLAALEFLAANAGGIVAFEAQQALDNSANGFNFGEIIASAGFAALGSYAGSQLADLLDMDPELAALVAGPTQAAIVKIGDNIIAGNPWNVGVSTSMLTSLGSVAGTILANNIGNFDTYSEQMGSNIGSNIGAFIFSSLGPVGTFIGSLLGGLLGGLIGGIFGDDPEGFADIEFNTLEDLYRITKVYGEDRAHKDVARDLAESHISIIKSILDLVDGDVLAGNVARLTFGFVEKEFSVKIDGQEYNLGSDAKSTINIGVFEALRSMEIAGGDVYARRAIHATLETYEEWSINTDGATAVPRTVIDPTGGSASTQETSSSDALNQLMSALMIAKEYQNYLRNISAINAIIAADPNSEFAIGWQMTLAQVFALGIHQRSEIDWTGGWDWWLQHNAVTSDKVVFTYLDGERWFVLGTNSPAVIADTIAPGQKDTISGGDRSDYIFVDAGRFDGDVSQSGKAGGFIGFNGFDRAGKTEIGFAARINGGAGDDQIYGGDLGNDLFGGAGDDLLIGGKLDDWLFGGDGNDVLLAGGGLGDVLDGGSGNDRLLGDDSEDWLSGGSGDDILRGFAGNDILEGGSGRDILIGGEGNDKYVYRADNGVDIITDSGVTGDDVIVFGNGILASDLIVHRSAVGDDLIIRINGNDAAFLVITGGLLTDFNGIERFEFSDGTVWTKGQMISASAQSGLPSVTHVGDGASANVLGTVGDDDLAGAGGNDVLQGGVGSDVYRFNLGDGADTIIDAGLTRDIDRVVFGAGIIPASLVLSRDLANSSVLVIGVVGTNDKLAIHYGNPDFSDGVELFEFADGTRLSYRELNKLYISQNQTTGNDVLVGGLGDEILFGGQGNDTLRGGGGYDQLSGGDGNDTYVYHRGDGYIAISESSGTDKLVFGEGVSLENIHLSVGDRDDRSLVITFRGMAGRIELLGQLTSSHIEQFELADGTVWSAEEIKSTLLARSADRNSDYIVGSTQADVLNGGAGDDRIYGYNDKDQIRGGAGDDVLIGGWHDDTYYYDLGDGNDVIVEGYGNGDIDKLIFGNGISLANLSYSQDPYSSANGWITFGNGERLTLLNMGRDYLGGVELLQTADGTTLDRQQILDLFRSSWMGSGKDVIRGFDTTDVLNGGAGDDRIYGYNDIDQIRGGNGDDVLIGGWHDDTYYYDLGDGNDVIVEGGYDGDNDRLVFGQGISLGNLTYSQGPYAATNGWITFGDGTRVTLLGLGNSYGSGIDRIETTDGTVLVGQQVLDLFRSSWMSAGKDVIRGFNAADVINGGDGDDQIYGYDGDDKLSGGIGDDVLIGGWGNDTYYYNLGDGNDVIVDATHQGEADRLVFGSGISLDNLSYSQDPYSSANGWITFANGERLILLNLGRYYMGGVEIIETADGAVLDRQQILDLFRSSWMSAGKDIIRGFNTTDIANGGAGDDRIYGYDGDDKLSGGTGNDVLIGGWGDDIYYYNSGDGNDIIVDASNEGYNDKLIFGAGISVSDLTFSFDAYDKDTLRIHLPDGSTIIIKDAFGSNGAGLESIEFVDGTVWNRSALAVAVGQQTATLNTIRGNSGVNTLTGTSANDSLDGLEGADTISGGAGDDVADGGLDNDTYLFGRGDGRDVFFGNSGTDTLKFGGSINASDINVRLYEINHEFLTLKIVGTTDEVSIRDVEKIEFADGTVWTEAQLYQVYADQNSTSGDDYIHTYDGNDIINAGAGDDLIYTESGNDIISGGAGDDYADGNWGNDTYIFNRGDGRDVFDGAFEIDTLRFGANISASEIVVRLMEADHTFLTLKIAGTTDEVSIRDVEKIEFADGTFWTQAQLYQAYADQNSTSGDDYIRTSYLNDVINAGAGDDRIYAESGDDIISGGAGDDYADGGSGNNTYIFNRGDGRDVFEGGIYNDTVLFGVGISPADIIVRLNEADHSFLTLKIAGSTDEISIRYVEKISFANGINWTHQQLIQIYADQNSTSGDDYFHFLAGTAVVNAGAGDDHIILYQGNDVISGGIGDDYVDGNAGNDIYIFNRGDGKDVFYGSSGSDTLRFGPTITVGDLRVFSGPSDWTTIILPDTGDIVEISNVEFVEFADGIRLSLADLPKIVQQSSANLGAIVGTSANDILIGTEENDRLRGLAGDDRLLGGRGADTYVFGIGDGHDTIEEYPDTISTDTLELGNGITTADVFFEASGQNSNDLILRIKSREETIVLKNQLTTNGAGIERLLFANGTIWTSENITANSGSNQPSSGDDVLTGTYRSDVLRGGGGNDVLKGGLGADRYLYSLGDGNDRISDFSSTEDIDELSFEFAYSGSGIVFQRASDGTSLLITVGGSSIVIENQLDNSGYGIDLVTFSSGEHLNRGDIEMRVLEASMTAGNDVIVGTRGNDIITGGAGNDVLDGQEGSDTYNFGSDDGHDVIQDGGQNLANDVIVFGPGIFSTSVLISREADGLYRIANNNNTWSVTLVGSFGGIEEFRFADGIVWTQANLKQAYYNSLASGNNGMITGDSTNEIINGGETSEIIRGGAGDDQLNGGAGDDVLFGDAGNDTLSGGAGNDTLEGGLGLDYYDGGNGFDTVDFSYSGADWVINLLGGQAHTLANPEGIETLVSIEKIVTGSGNDNLTGGIANEVLITGAGDDYLDGGAGDDELLGGKGDDVYNYGRGGGHDTVAEDQLGGNADRLVFNGLSTADIGLSRMGDDLIISVWDSSAGANDGGSITIRNTLGENSNSGIELFTLMEGTYTKADVQSVLLSQAMTANDDVIEGFRNTGDYLEGGAGNDAFVFKPNFGWDTIGDFVAGGGTDDVLEFRGSVLADFEAVLAAASQVGNDTIINIDGTNGITLANVNLADLHRDDVRFVA